MKRTVGIVALAIAACAACCAPLLAPLVILGGATSLGGVALGWWGAGLILVSGSIAILVMRRRRLIQARCACGDAKCTGSA
jgi:hypothetical protein